MRLLFDQNLSFRLVDALVDVFPGSSQVRLPELDRADDRTLWEWAAQERYVLVTQDADFSELAAFKRSPPKVIWLRCGNQPTRFIQALLIRTRAGSRHSPRTRPADCLEIG